MDVEVSVAWNFVISYLYNKLPRRRVDCFGQELEKGLKRKFDGHWYPDMPFKGSAFRCVKFNGVAADPLVEQAAIHSGMNIEEVRDYLPNELTLWVDPKEVSYRIGEKGLVKILYSDKKSSGNDDGFPCEVPAECDELVPGMNGCFNPEAQSFRPIETLSASMSSLNLSPVDGSSPTSPAWGSPSPTHGLHSSTGNSPINNPFIPMVPRSHVHQQQEQKFTAAMFAQTKFGSTKLKSNAKRPNRLSPTDFGGGAGGSTMGYNPGITAAKQQRHVLQSHWINGVGAVSPVGAAGYHAAMSAGFPAPSNMAAAAAAPFSVGGAHAQMQPHGIVRGGRNQSLSPRDPRQDLIAAQQQMMLLQQQHLQLQQQQQQQQNQQQQPPHLLHRHTSLPNGLPSPTSTHPLGSINGGAGPLDLAPNSDLFPSSHIPTSSNPSSTSSAAAAFYNNTPSISNTPANPRPTTPQPPQAPAGVSTNENTPFSPNEKAVTSQSDLGLQGIMGRLAASQSEGENMAADTSGFVNSGLNNENAAATWSGGMSSPYASLQHLLVAN